MSSVSVMRAWPRVRLALGGVGTDVDDEMAGEGVSQVVEAKRQPAVVQPSALGCYVRPTIRFKGASHSPFAR
jgi:hypothetical protein